MLDDLFAALVLDVEIDVRRLGSLDAQKTLEQKIHPYGINCRDTETETHGAVRRTATTLAQDALLAAVLNDLVHREEVSAVVQLANDLKLTFDLCANVRRHLAPITSARASEREVAQPTLLTVSRGKIFLGISIAKIVETERALFGDLERTTKACGVVRKETFDLLAGFEIVLGVCADCMSGLGEHFSLANTGQNVL